MNRDKLYLEDILTAIKKIESYTTSGHRSFSESPLIQDAVIRNFEIIGEATKRLSDSIRGQYPNIPWRNVAGFRDILIHDYDRVGLEEVWSVVERDLPNLRQNIVEILQVLK